MLRWVSGINKIEEIGTEEIVTTDGVAKISENNRGSARLRWLERTINDDVMMRTMKVSRHRRRGRQ